MSGLPVRRLHSSMWDLVGIPAFMAIMVFLTWASAEIRHMIGL